MLEIPVMAPRSSWKGFIKLSLVSVPVKAFTASNTREEIRLNQLHRDCHARVRYKKVCPEHGELKQDQIVSGYEYTKDNYVVIDPEEVAALRKQSDKAISIEGFVDESAVDPIYFAGRTYFLLPDGVAGDRPYALLAKGMVEAGVYAIARLVMSGRVQLVLVRPVDGMLTMNVLNYAKRIKDMGEFRDELTEQDMSKEELALAETLISASRIEDLDLTDFKDDYTEELTELIKLKLDGEEIVQAPEPEEPKIINLMEALKQSVAEAQAGKRKMAPSAKTTRKKAAKKKKAAKRKTG